jgi:hypothetical protein
MAREPEPGGLAPTPRASDRDRMLTVSALPATLGQRRATRPFGNVEQSRAQGLPAVQVGWHRAVSVSQPPDVDYRRPAWMQPPSTC